MRAAAPGPSSTSTTCSAAPSGAACCRCSTTRRWPTRCATPTRCSRAVRASSTTRWRSSSTTTIRVVAASAIHFVVRAGRCGRSRMTSSTSSPIGARWTRPSSKRRTGRCGSRSRPRVGLGRGGGAPGRGAGRPGARHPAVRVRVGGRAVPHRGRRRGDLASAPDRNCFAPACRRRTSSSCSKARSSRTAPTSRPRPSSASTRCSRARRRPRPSARPGRSSACASPPPTCSRCSRTDVQLAQGLFRMLLAPAPDRLLAPLRSVEIGRRRPGRGCRACVLVRHPLFERASAPQLLALTSATVDVPLADGTPLFRAGDHAGPLPGDEWGGRARRLRGPPASSSGRARRWASPRPWPA